MKISYHPLFKLLIDRNIRKGQLCTLAGISSNSVSKMAANQPVKMDIIVKVCEALQADLPEVMELVNDDGSRISWNEKKQAAEP